jgi:hypothetical protein
VLNTELVKVVVAGVTSAEQAELKSVGLNKRRGTGVESIDSTGAIEMGITGIENCLGMRTSFSQSHFFNSLFAGTAPVVVV